jgi:predicted RNA-binding protein YlqC (UPF0109 family)
MNSNDNIEQPELNVKEFLKIIVGAIVDKPADVTVKEISSDRMVLYELKVNQSDMGVVIGRRGHHAQALRTLLAATSGKRRKRALLEIIE